MKNFRKYYQKFLDNNKAKKKFRITFKDDTEIICIPLVGSIATPDDSSEFKIIVHDSNGTQRQVKKTFSEIENVEEVSA